MKQTNKLFLLLATGVVLAVSCGKDTAVSPKKTIGNTGAPTVTSSTNTSNDAVGPANATGSVIYSGTTPPSTSIGVDGDYYLDKGTGLLYGPKTDSGWGTGFSLVGPKGLTGAAGNSVLNGTGAPASTLGKTGDFYLDISTYMFYGPKTTAGGWGTPVSLLGAKGLTGAAGNSVLNGTGVPASTLGKTGDFYLDISTYMFYGPKTTAGGWGTPTSLIGTKGLTGAAGNTILSGTGAPASTLGKTGDYYLDKSTFLFYGPKATATGWGVAVSLKGQTGPKGDAGTANVQFSGWNSATNPRDTTVDGSKIKVEDVAAPALSQTVLDGGAVLVYFRFGSSGVFTLPYTSNAGGAANTISFLPRLQHIIITRFTFDNSGSIAFGAVEFRYILIPGGVALSAIKNSHINLNDYDAVRAYLKIE